MSKGERISRFVAELRAEDAAPDQDDIAKHPFYRAFFHCWNEQHYYEAHDVLEQLWLKTKSSDADYFKGLIQAAGAFVHLQKRFEHPSHAKHGKRLPPAVRLFRLPERNLSRFGPRHHGVDDPAFLQPFAGVAHRIVASDYKPNLRSPDASPKLNL